MSPESEVQRVESTVGRDWWVFLVLGAALILVGIFAITAPLVTSVVLALMLGWILVFGAIAHIYQAFKTREHGGLWWNLVTAMLYGVAGVLLVARPLGGVLTLSLVLAAFLTVDGLFRIFSGLRFRRLPNWGWTLVNGIISLILGVVIWAHWPISL